MVPDGVSSTEGGVPSNNQGRPEVTKGTRSLGGLIKGVRTRLTNLIVRNAQRSQRPLEVLARVEKPNLESPSIYAYARNLRDMKDAGNANEDSVSELAEKLGVEVVEVGSDTVVVALPGSSDKVVALDFDHDTSPEGARRIYYNHKILHILFPHNFPKIYRSFGKHPERNNITGTIRQRIMPGEMRNPDYAFLLVQRVCNDLQLPVSFDLMGDNLLTGEDGGEYYVDRVSSYRPYHPSDLPRDWNLERITKYMEEKKYSEEDVSSVQRAIKRLQSLK